MWLNWIGKKDTDSVFEHVSSRLNLYDLLYVR